MDDSERKKLAEAAIPLEVLVAHIREKPLRELTDGLQQQLAESLLVIRELLFERKLNTE